MVRWLPLPQVPGSIGDVGPLPKVSAERVVNPAASAVRVLSASR